MPSTTYRITFITKIGNELGSQARMLTLSEPIAFASDLIALRNWAVTEFAVEFVEITSVLQMSGVSRPSGQICVLGSKSL